VRTDDAGRFQMLAARDLAYTVIAFDPSDMRPARCRGVHAGDLTLELRFGSGGTLELRVRDAGGPLGGAWAMVLDATAQRSLARGHEQACGRVLLDVPAAPFIVSVSTPFHRERRLGPFDPAAAPAQLEVVLERAEG